MEGKPLQLTSSHVPLVFQNPLSSLVTSMSYFDQETDSKYLKEAQRLIEDEKKSMPQKDYLENFPTPKFSKFTPRSEQDIVDFEKYKINENPKSLQDVKSETEKIQTLISGNSVKLIFVINKGK